MYSRVSQSKIYIKPLQSIDIVGDLKRSVFAALTAACVHLEQQPELAQTEVQEQQCSIKMV